MLRTLLLVAAAFSLVAFGAQGAEGLLPILEPGGSGLSPPDVARLIEQLDAPDFGDRQEASNRLGDAGRSVLPDLEKAATAPVREVAGRALDILKLHFQRGDADLKQAAKESLGRLAEHKNVSIAQRARNVIDPPKDIAYSGPFGPGFRGPIPFGPPVFVPPPATRTVSSSEINGKRDVEIKDEARTIKMQTWPNGRIEIDIQEKLPGQPAKKLDAKDLGDLKAKDAEVARLYEQYQQQQRGRLGAAPMPAPLGALPAANAELAKRMLETIDASIERYKARLPNDPNAQRTIDSLERLKQQYRSSAPPAQAPAPRPVETAQRPALR